MTLKLSRPETLTVKAAFTLACSHASDMRRWHYHRQAVQAVKSSAPIGQGRANMALGVVLGQLASLPGLPQRDRADYHDEAMLALQQAVACDPADVNILYNLALIQVGLVLSAQLPCMVGIGARLA